MTHQLRLPIPLYERLATFRPPIVITGGTGWLGLATLHALEASMGRDFVADNVHVFASTAGTITLQSGTMLRCQALADALRTRIAGRPIVLHYAFQTKDKVEGMPLAGYLDSNQRICRDVAEACRAWSPRAVYVASAGAVYQADRRLVGSPDASPYGFAKLEQERIFTELAAELDMFCLIGRLFALSGEFINKHEMYVLSACLSALARGEAIRLHATRRVYRSYIYVGDVIATVLHRLLDGAPPIAATIDLCGADLVEVGDLARLCAAVMRRNVGVTRPSLNHSLPDDTYQGDPDDVTRLMRLYGVVPTPLPEQIRRTGWHLGVASPSSVPGMLPE